MAHSHSAVSAMPVAYLPQHAWQVGGTLFGIVVIAWMIYIFIRGEVAQVNSDPRTVRLVAFGCLLIGAGVIVGAWTLNAEPPCGSCNRDHWGGTSGIVGLTVWVVVLLAVMAHNVRDERRRLRAAHRREAGEGQRTGPNAPYH